MSEASTQEVIENPPTPPSESPPSSEKENTHPLSPPWERARACPGLDPGVRGNRDDTNESDEALLRRISNLSNQRFERFIVVLLASIGMTDVVIINRLRPGELDIHASMDIAEVMDINFSIQALNWHRDVHGGDIQLLRGGMRFGDHGLIITTSDFQRGAIERSQPPRRNTHSHHQRHPT